MDIRLPDRELGTLLDHPLVTGLLDGVSDGVLVIGLPDRDILAMNRVARELLAYQPSETLGCQCRKLMNAPACSNACPLTAALEGRDRERTLDLVYRGRDGDHLLHAHTRMILVRDGEGEAMAGIELFRDIRQVRALQNELSERQSLQGIVGSAPCMRALFTLVTQIAPFDIPVLISGASGVGKERFADAVRATSDRADKPYLKINCAALSESLVESTLFGHTRGAFTGANAHRRGHFEEASGGTLLLDEVGELPLNTQAKLLRVLQEGEITRVGEDRVRRVDVRIIAATNRHLEDAVRTGRFREDLYYRLAGARIQIPPLRERKEDIPALCEHFLRREAARNPGRGLPIRLGPDALSALIDRDWPGNVRELGNVLLLAAIKARGNPEITRADLGFEPALIAPDPSPRTLADLERIAIDRAMRDNDGNATAAARQLGIDRSTLWRKLKSKT